MPQKYNDVYLDIRRALKREGVTQPELEAREIICHAAGKSRDEFRRDMMLYISRETEDAVAELLKRRLSGEPLPYITGGWEFMGNELEVTRNVLIPRADTEILCEYAIEQLCDMSAAPVGGRQIRVLDLCCGSGCIGISIALACPGCGVILGDISTAAMQVARRNIRRHSLSARVACVQVDALKPANISLGSFDMIVSNPPYIPTGDIDGLDSSVKDFEPRLALDGGEDGLDFYRSIASGFKLILRRGGVLMMEIGAGQARAVETILRENGWSGIEIYRDLAGIQRVIKCSPQF